MILTGCACFRSGNGDESKWQNTSHNPLRELRSDQVQRLDFKGLLSCSHKWGLLFTTTHPSIIDQFVDCLRGLPDGGTIISPCELVQVDVLDIQSNILAHVSIEAREGVVISKGRTSFTADSRALALFTFDVLAYNVPQYLVDGDAGKYLVDVDLLRRIFPFDGSCYTKHTKAVSQKFTTKRAEPSSGGDGKPAPQK